VKIRKNIKNLIFSRLDDLNESSIERNLNKELWGLLYVTKFDFRWYVFIGMRLHEKA